MFVIDAASVDPTPTAQLKSLQIELKMYQPEMCGRVNLVVANKMDLLTAGEGEREMEGLRRVSGLPVAPVSALRMTSQEGHWWRREQLSRTLFKIATLIL